MTKTYKTIQHKGYEVLYRKYGHRGGKTYEVRIEQANGETLTAKQNVGWWVVDEADTVQELADILINN